MLFSSLGVINYFSFVWTSMNSLNFGAKVRITV